MIKPTYSKSAVDDWGLTKAQFDAIFQMCYAESTTVDFRDEITDEINATKLAEYVAMTLDHDEWLDDETHPLWDIAAYVAETRSTIVTAYPLKNWR